MSILSLKLTTEQMIKLGEQRVKNSFLKTYILGFMGGIFIAFGCLGTIVATAYYGVNGRFLGAFLFPVGLMFVILVGGSLFTGNCLTGVAYITKKIKLNYFFKDLMVVWIGNLSGAVFISFIMVNAKVFSDSIMIETAIKIAQAKLQITFVEGVFSGFLCNILVAGAVWKSNVTEEAVGKIMACWFPIMLFAFLGFQHVVANMAYLSIGKFLAQDIYTIMYCIKNNFVPVTLGNFLSGGVFLPLMYSKIYLK